MMMATSSSVTLAHEFLWVLLYIGPDVMLPLASALTAVAGVVLMFWQRLVGLLRLTRDTLLQRHKAPRA